VPTQIEIPGYCSVMVQQATGALGGITTLTELGITRNGVTVIYENFFYDVPGDEFGGDDGPPIDTQWLGAISRIRCEFTKYNRTVMEAVLGIVQGSTFGAMEVQGAGAGVSKQPGELMFTGTNFTRVVLNTSIGDRRNFPRCFIRAPHEQNYSTKYASPIVEFESHAHQDGNGDWVLHNTFVGEPEDEFPG
jgi:hypothetical protein